MLAWSADWVSSLFSAGVHAAWWLPLVATPAGFGAIVWATRNFAPEAAGSGIPQTIAAAQHPTEARKRLISMKTAGFKFVMMLAALLAGASVGREGPTVQISAAIMVWYHRVFRVPLRASMIIAGGAAGVAAAFNTPLAGITFAIEELAEAYEQRVALLVMSAIVIAGMVSLGVAGNYVYFGSVADTLKFEAVLRMAPLAGVIGGLTGGVFARILLALSLRREQILPAITSRPVVWAIACGAVVALTGVATGSTWGTGYGPARAIIEGAGVPFWFGPAKLLATLASASSGLPGGIFAPSLAVGAGVGNVLRLAFPADPPSAVVLLGMAAYFTGVVRAPITAVIIIVEATASRGLILPLFVTALFAHAASRAVCRERLYFGLSKPWRLGAGKET